MGEGAMGETMARPATGRHRGQRAVPVVVTLLVLAALVGAGLYVVRGATGPRALPGQAAPVGVTPQVASSSPGGGPSSVPPGEMQVTLASALHDAPHAEEVVALFRTYFNAINARDYQAWLGVLSRNRKPDPQATFSAQYASTADDQVHVVGIEPDPNTGGLLVAVSFRSRQDPRLAPSDAPYGCLNWQIQYPVAEEDSVLKISLVPNGNRRYQPC